MKNNLKRLILLAALFISAVSVSAQAQKVFNFGGVGTGLYGNIEFPVAKSITVGPGVFTDWNFNDFVIAAKGSYYFDILFDLPPEWNVYLGGNVGWRLGDDNGANWGAHIGGRWFWNEKWGINAEFGGGSGVNGGVGVTLRF